MAITGTDIVQDSMYQAGVLGVGDALSNSDAQAVLRTLNRMLDSWSNERLMIYDVLQDSFPMVAGTAVYDSSLLSSGRPVNIDSIFVRLSNIDWPVEIVDVEDFSNIPYKIVQSVPTMCNIDFGMPNVTFTFYPIPYAAFTCFLNIWRELPTPVTLATSLALPPGYEHAIVTNLAMQIGPMFGRPPDQVTVQAARESRAVIKRLNYSPKLMETGLDRRGDPSNGFIYKGF